MEKSIDIIYFSKDRPLQLDLALNSNRIQCQDIGNNVSQKVIYLPTNNHFAEAYLALKEQYTEISFIKQTDDFKKDLLDNIFADYVMFVVDDTVFVKKYWLHDAVNTLNLVDDALGFSFRLGQNTLLCYPYFAWNSMPYILNIHKSQSNNYITSYNWAVSGNGDFSYPFEVSSSIYSIEVLSNALREPKYHNPNTLEAQLALAVSKFSMSHNKLLCYKNSVAFSNPVNIVQSFNNNRYGNHEAYNPENLLALFNQGYRINPIKYEGMVPIGCHQEIPFELIKQP